MLAAIRKSWSGFFLAEKPSVSLSLFRFAAAFTVGAHIVPTLLHMEDNYLSTAFKEKNVSFFPAGFLIWIESSPDWVVQAMAAAFFVSLAFFACGFLTQVSAIALGACCYYFYALNSLHIGTLSYDILLVTLFLVCLTPYPGDSFSLDAFIFKKKWVDLEIKRPVFVQRLLQIQIASTYFYTGLCKFTAGGNWLHDNPIYHLVRSGPESVVKEFFFRGALAQNPGWCYAIGITVIVTELLLPFGLFYGKTRGIAVAWGFLFHWLLLETLHVPTIFFFLFPPQLLLFIEPETVAETLRKLTRRNLRP